MATIEEELPVSLAEAQAYVRVETGEEEALLAGQLRTATQLCEAFTGQWLLARSFETMLPASGGWQKLSVFPVRTIETVVAIDAEGNETTLAASDYAIDVDASGHGWVRLSQVGAARKVKVMGEAGMAADPNGLPEPLRQGIVRLVAHMFAHRDGDGDAPPSAVTALWRPYRRVRL